MTVSPFRQRVAIVTVGDPRDPRTNSGWPPRVIQEFEKMGIEVVGVNTHILGPFSKLLCYSLYQLWRFRPARLLRSKLLLEEIRLITGYPSRDFQRMRMPQSRRARYMLKQVRAQGVRKVLHWVQNNISLDTEPHPDLEQYLLLDSTWHIESVNLSFRDRFTPGIIKAFQESEKRAFAHIQHFFPMSEYIAEDLVNYYGIPDDRITVIGSGWGDIEPFFGEKDYLHGPVLCSAKQRFEDKGGRLLIDAFRIAKQRMPHLRLIIVGQESYRKRFRNIPGLTLHGYIPWERLQTLFKESALFAMPAYAEPWGTVYLEALVSKTPILGLRRTAMPEFTDNGRFGFMVDNPEPEAVANAIIEAMSDPVRLRRMGEAGQQYVLDRYSWKTMISRLAKGMGLQLNDASEALSFPKPRLNRHRGLA